MKSQKSINPWLWVPTLYFLEGIPYVLVNQVSTMMFTKMGVPNGQMALFTSLLYLPWVIKPFWSPFVDLIKTKRWWTIAMQILLTAAFIGLTVTIPHPDVTMIAAQQTPMSMFSVMLIIFWITAFASATHDIAADGFYMLGLSQSDQAWFVGIRSTFYRIATIFGQGAILFIAGRLETSTGDIPLAWQISLLITSIIFAVFTLWHTFFLPKPAADAQRQSETDKEDSTEKAKFIIYEFARTFITFFKKPGVWLAIIFMLLYRLPEAFLIKMINPFLVASRDLGGLAMSTDQVGLAYGTIGIIFLTIGGILGGMYASKVGLRKSMWVMAAFMTLPCLSFVYLGVYQPANIIAITAAIAVEQFGYGFGFTAYMLYMIYVSEGEYKTAHYAFCTAFMGLSMMIPGIFAGYIQEALGYKDFFWMVIACCIATIAVTYFAYHKVDPAYGKK
ncbi:MAG: MFS transporter [Paludibacteraceae bacterium]|nr:MFS transporter [Paludibacteraceae bacterium]